MRRALVQGQGRSNLGQAEGNVAFSQQVEDSKRSVEGLDFVRSLRGSVPHYEPPSRRMNLS